MRENARLLFFLETHNVLAVNFSVAELAFLVVWRKKSMVCYDYDLLIFPLISHYWVAASCNPAYAFFFITCNSILHDTQMIP